MPRRAKSNHINYLGAILGSNFGGPLVKVVEPLTVTKQYSVMWEDSMDLELLAKQGARRIFRKHGVERHEI